MCDEMLIYDELDMRMGSMFCMHESYLCYPSNCVPILIPGVSSLCTSCIHHRHFLILKLTGNCGHQIKPVHCRLQITGKKTSWAKDGAMEFVYGILSTNSTALLHIVNGLRNQEVNQEARKGSTRSLHSVSSSF